MPAALQQQDKGGMELPPPDSLEWTVHSKDPDDQGDRNPQAVLLLLQSPSTTCPQDLVAHGECIR